MYMDTSTYQHVLVLNMCFALKAAVDRQIHVDIDHRDQLQMYSKMYMVDSTK